MPIRPEARALYPPDWPQISRSIRVGRARGWCECTGECGRDGHDAGVAGNRCSAMQGEPHPVTGSTVVLTVAHLDHDPANCDRSNLKAMCQRCHLAYDAAQHAATARRTRLAGQVAGMDPLFDSPDRQQDGCAPVVRLLPGEADPARFPAAGPASPSKHPAAAVPGGDAAAGVDDPPGGDWEGTAGPVTAPPTVTVVVYGKPIGQGRISYNSEGHGYHSNSNELKPWRADVRDAALAQLRRHEYQTWDARKRCAACGIDKRDHAVFPRGPVGVAMTLVFDKPKTAPRDRTTWPVTRYSGDWDHLGRALGDALTGVVWHDDSQITDGHVRKLYSDDPTSPLTAPGAHIAAWCLDPAGG